MSLYWLSFADERGFRGGLLAEGDFPDVESLVRTTWRRGVNPGGEIKFAEVSERGPFEPWKLYSREEIDRIDKGLPWTDKAPGQVVCELCGTECRGH